MEVAWQNLPAALGVTVLVSRLSFEAPFGAIIFTNDAELTFVDPGSAQA